MNSLLSIKVFVKFKLNICLAYTVMKLYNKYYENILLRSLGLTLVSSIELEVASSLRDEQAFNLNC